MPSLPSLLIPLSMLESMRAAEDFTRFSQAQLQALHRDYSPQEISNIMEALGYAASHPEHNFKSMLPGLRFDNPSIHAFLCRVHQHLDGHLQGRGIGD